MSANFCEPLSSLSMSRRCFCYRRTIPLPSRNALLMLALALMVSVLNGLGAPYLKAQDTPAQLGDEPSRFNFHQWESVGFSADGRFYAGISYGVEHDLAQSESHFFARLQVLHLNGVQDEVVLERILRRNLALRSELPARFIMQDLLRRESRELRKFQIEALEQGEVLLSPQEGQVLWPSQSASIEQGEVSGTYRDNITLGEMTLARGRMDIGQEFRPFGAHDFDVAIEELTQIQRQQQEELQEQGRSPNILERVYTVTRNANTTVFQLRQLRLDSSNSLRGQIVAVQSQGFPHRYNFQQNWNTLLQRNLLPESELNIQPVFISLSPDAKHLLLTLRIFRLPELPDRVEVARGKDAGLTSDNLSTEQEGQESAAEANAAKLQDIMRSSLEDNDNYAFVTFSVQVY